MKRQAYALRIGLLLAAVVLAGCGEDSDPVAPDPDAAPAPGTSVSSSTESGAEPTTEPSAEPSLPVDPVKEPPPPSLPNYGDGKGTSPEDCNYQFTNGVPGTLTGHVRTSAGEPVVGLDLEIQVAGFDPFHFQGGGTKPVPPPVAYSTYVTTSADGGFEVERVPGCYSVRPAPVSEMRCQPTRLDSENVWVSSGRTSTREVVLDRPAGC